MDIPQSGTYIASKPYNAHGSVFMSRSRLPNWLRMAFAIAVSRVCKSM
jgi:hypothetical protein